jgi:hypothetical protein
MADKSTRKPTKPAAKRPWRRPQVKTGQLFESNSLSCGKTMAESGGVDQCAQMANAS